MSPLLTTTISLLCNLASITAEPVAGQRAYAGTELDLNVIYTIGRGMTLRLLGATFMPGARHYPVTAPGAMSDAYYVETQYTFTF